MRSRRVPIVLAILLFASTLAALAPHAVSVAAVRVVPTDYDTIQGAVNAAEPGDTVYILDGVYEEAVEVTEHDLLILGESQDGTILEGNDELDNGFHIAVDNVAVERLTVQNYAGNGVYFEGVNGFRISHVTSIRNADYGLYAIKSANGLIDHNFATLSGDSGFYIGETDYCFCVLEYNEGTHSALGYSGTHSNYVTLRYNNFHDNRAGILTSTLPSEPGLQGHATIVDNWVHDNNDGNTPLFGFTASVTPPTGLGIGIGGGLANTVARNRVENNHLWGIAIFWLEVPSSSNRVVQNSLSNNGVDLWWEELGVDNCWEANDFLSSDPASMPACDGHNVGPGNPLKLAELAQLALFPDGPGAKLRQVTGAPVPDLPTIYDLP